MELISSGHGNRRQENRINNPENVYVQQESVKMYVFLFVDIQFPEVKCLTKNTIQLNDNIMTYNPYQIFHADKNTPTSSRIST